MDERICAFFTHNRLWQGSRIILPEHRAGAVVHVREAAPIPCPTQEYLEEIQALVLAAREAGRPVTLLVNREGRLEKLTGIPLSVGQPPGTLRWRRAGTVEGLAIMAIVGAEEP
ncbi:hypothetical protein HM1_2537 [Heliomicrobium modesticaldum Ice1]|uniref:Uncharacterized protein n=1 Tax=Heliobacterium modesticaldum (strain ATCC 51547 / Ice1) TaxID=498761 RepID=B0TAW3_HELMI|nr:hypothetical protein [Heliomicrobium modesticaldum]ABZ85074.1 hypothetical protein HM1_2537 [Heliomicrobium modesticaldum Ice1]